MNQKSQNSSLPLYVIIGLGGFLLLQSTVFQVFEIERALVFRFGKLVDVYDEPGLKVKVPFLDKVVSYDKRLQGHQLEPLEITASDQKRIIMSLYARFRISDPVEFYRTIGTTQDFILRLQSISESAMREVIGSYELNSLFSEQRTEIMNRIQKRVYHDSKTYGVDVMDVRIVEAELPEKNRVSVFRRMRSDREKEARAIRATGEEESEKIRANADAQQRVLLAEATRDAAKIKGEGIAKSIEIYGRSVSKDPKFFEFFRSLEAYKKAMKSSNTTYVLSTEEDFFKYLKSPK